MLIISGAILEIGSQQLHIAAETRIVSYKPENASRNNAVYGVAGFIGNLVGGSPMDNLQLRYGWRALGAASLAFAGAQVAIQLLRGPQEPHNVWLGWRWGRSLRRPQSSQDNPEAVPQQNSQDVEEGISKRESEE